MRKLKGPLASDLGSSPVFTDSYLEVFHCPSQPHWMGNKDSYHLIFGPAFSSSIPKGKKSWACSLLLFISVFVKWQNIWDKHRDTIILVMNAGSSLAFHLLVVYHWAVAKKFPSLHLFIDKMENLNTYIMGFWLMLRWINTDKVCKYFL